LREVQKEKEEAYNEANKAEKERLHSEMKCRDYQTNNQEIQVVFKQNRVLGNRKKNCGRRREKEKRNKS
jgi:hypothetical protein